MKQKFLTLIIMLIVLFLNSCSPNDIEDELQNFQENNTSVRIKKEILINGQTTIVEERKDGYLFEGDIIIPKNSQAKSSGFNLSSTSLWPTNVIPYEIEPGIQNPSRIIKAINEIQNKTFLRFVERDNQDAYLYFKSNIENFAGIGYIGRRNNININDGASYEVVIHEIGHTLGLLHEHTRSDRDEFINIIYENIVPEYFPIFKKVNEDSRVTNFTPFDFESVMMYSAYQGTKNSEPTITKKDGSLFSKNIRGLSPNDALGLNIMYPNDDKLTLEHWAHRQGSIFSDSQIWMSGDFNGDGKDDFAKILESNHMAIIDVHISNGTDFSFSRWAFQQGGLYGTEKWVVGDFNGDGMDDIAKAFPDRGKASLDVHISNGNKFFIQRWATRQGGFWDSQKWFTGDFNGDGKDDMAKVFNNNGLADIDVHLSNNNSFSIQRWATGQGGFWDSQKWFTGDFNGDGKDDMAKAFNNDGLADIDVHLSNNNSFSIQRWATEQGGFWDAQIWMSGDFNGDGKDDAAKVFKDDNYLGYIDAHFSNGSNFSMERMSTRQGGLYGKEKWATGDFNGDGKDDFTKSFNNNGLPNIDVHLVK
ncbi:M12 family metallopeptidase [uncultured Aquimarina sp.]|uniref:M12 family metallopeptidase n=1 Tax=uncultured Aquimarina sp. TaxID=575652 RepID=UPI002621795A|nr:M12 family metallopeptidase [uncultured Aquimarina sp.]